MNIDNMLKLKTFILQEGEDCELPDGMTKFQFNMEWWGTSVGCGFAACLAGSAVACLGTSHERQVMYRNGIATAAIADRLLGLEKAPHSGGVTDIFHSSLFAWPAAIRNEYLKATNKQERAIAAAKLIDHLICEEVARLKQLEEKEAQDGQATTIAKGG